MKSSGAQAKGPARGRGSASARGKHDRPAQESFESSFGSGTDEEEVLLERAGPAQDEADLEDVCLFPTWRKKTHYRSPRNEARSRTKRNENHKNPAGRARGPGRTRRGARAAPFPRRAAPAPRLCMLKKRSKVFLKKKSK